MARESQQFPATTAAAPRGSEPPISDEPKTGLAVPGDGPMPEAESEAAGLREIQLEIQLRLTLDGQRVS